MRWGVTALLCGALGCQGQHPGDRCDGFFQNGCKAPLSCITLVGSGTLLDRKLCAGSCDHGFACHDRAGCCPPGFACVDVSLSTVHAGDGLSLGGHCLPRELVKR
jgi:hypothetical protein